MAGELHRGLHLATLGAEASPTIPLHRPPHLPLNLLLPFLIRNINRAVRVIAILTKFRAVVVSAFTMLRFV